MESSKIFGATEECQSSESGWTMYIGSPIAGDDDYDESHSVKGASTKYVANHEDADSDDSMASDASSGPSRNGENGHGGGMAYFKHDEKRDKYKSEKKETNKPGMEKQRDIRRKEEIQELVFVAKRAHSTPLQSGDKVRRNNWMGKRK